MLLMDDIKDVLEHKKYVFDACFFMAEYLISIGEEELGKELLRRAIVHDNSRFSDQEIESFSKIAADKEDLHNAEAIVTDFKRKAIEIHWKNNRHHPEFFSNVENMDEVDILEMVCDWAAKSYQTNTSLLEFVKIRQENRFHFPEDMFAKILKYCEILEK